ncbi:hypothetical protein [Modestobacter marinus]|uniref:hypothetical protein n=1 Tax=Modestobacter marinus TaxID=477641 RepID=UPI001C942043|nr:hypothetical protein [Modestobacter marinus]
MSTVDGVDITGPMGPRYEEVLTPRGLGLIATLHRELNGRRLELLQWLHNGGTLADGQQVSTDLVQRVIDEEMGTIRDGRGDAFAAGRWDDAQALFTEMVLADEYPDSLTVPAYERMP